MVAPPIGTVDVPVLAFRAPPAAGFGSNSGGVCGGGQWRVTEAPEESRPVWAESTSLVVPLAG